MVNLEIEQRSFLGKSAEVLGNLLAYIEEAKGVLESEVLKGPGFGLIFYKLDEDGGKTVVLKSDDGFRHFDPAEPSTPSVFADETEKWNRSVNILRDWKHVEPSSIIYGWKNRLSFVFSHSMALPTMAVDECALDPKGVVECHIFRSISSGIIPFILIDGAVSAPRPKTLCLLQAAPEEGSLYSRLKVKAEHEQATRQYYVTAMLKSKRPAILIKALKYLQQMKCPEDLIESVVNSYCDKPSGPNGKLLEVLERSQLGELGLSPSVTRFSERLATAIDRR